MKSVRGDLIKLALAGHFDVIVHGCNCQCRMSRGIALAVKNTFPEAVAADLATIKGDLGKLGFFSSATVDRSGHGITIVNAYTQLHPEGEGVLVDYDAVRAVMRRIKASFAGSRIGYPLIGAGLARGDWSVISRVIEEELAGEDHTLVEFVA